MKIWLKKIFNKIKSIRKDEKFLKFLFPLLIVMSFYLYYKTIFDLDFDVNLLSLAFDFILVSLVYLFVLGITKKTNITSLIIGIIFSIFMTATIIKVYYSNDPILFSDFKYLSDIFEITDIVDNSLFFVSITVTIPIFVYIILNIFYIYKTFKHKYSINNIFLRLTFIIIPIIIYGLLLNPSSSFKHFMLRNVYKVERSDDSAAMTSNIGHYGLFGIASGMYAHYLENVLDIPENYNDDNLNNLLVNSAVTNTKQFGTPNIIVIFEESFWDINRINNEISFDKKITENFNNFKEEGISFNMISPTYGGISGNVEFEFLSGANMSYFGSGYVPYMQLYTNKNYYNAPSIIHELKNNDYYTKVVAYTGPRLFNCSKFYKYAGFDTTEYNYEVKELPKKLDESIKKGPNVSDEHIVDEIIKEFNNKEKGKKEFYMVLTMQTHSPYDIDKYDKYDISVKKSIFNRGLTNSLLSYAQGIYDADQQLARLYNYIKTLEEPTIIIFYGDHLPHITDNYGNSLLEKSQYFNTKDQVFNTFRKYNTESLILANFEISEDNYKYVSPDLLSTYVLNNMDIKLSNYYKWLYSNLDTIPSLNRYVVSDANGNVYNVKSLPNNIYKNYNLREQMQYKFFVKDKLK